MGLQIVTPPSAAITLDEAKAQLNVVDADDDQLISDRIAAATSTLDDPFGWLGRAIMPQTWDYFRDSFPTSTAWNSCNCSWSALQCNGIELPLPPLIHVDSVAYADPEDASSYLTLASTEYAVDVAGYVGWVQPVSEWPATATAINAIRV